MLTDAMFPMAVVAGGVMCPIPIAAWVITFCLPNFLLDLQLDPVLNCGVRLLCAVKQFTP